MKRHSWIGSAVRIPFLITAVLAGCQAARVAPPVMSAEDRVAPPVSVKKILAVYEGVLPCADCQGIRTELTLFDEDFTYKLVETFLGTPDGDRTVESEGTWTLRRPSRRDPEATVYQLRPREPGEVRNFLIVDEQQIRQLDGNGPGIESQADRTLTRRSTPAGNSR